MYIYIYIPSHRPSASHPQAHWRLTGSRVLRTGRSSAPAVWHTPGRSCEQIIGTCLSACQGLILVNMWTMLSHAYIFWKSVAITSHTLSLSLSGTFVYISLYIHMYMFACMYMCICTQHKYIHIYTHIHICIYIYICMYLHLCIIEYVKLKYMYMYMYIYIYIYIERWTERAT